MFSIEIYGVKEVDKMAKPALLPSEFSRSFFYYYFIFLRELSVPQDQCFCVFLSVRYTEGKAEFICMKLHMNILLYSFMYSVAH